VGVRIIGVEHSVIQWEGVVAQYIGLGAGVVTGWSVKHGAIQFKKTIWFGGKEIKPDFTQLVSILT
jgi:hypothetical protein